MTYGLRSITTAASKSNKIYTARIYEKNFAGSVEVIPAGPSPFEQNILASSDDPFEPIVASDLTVVLDATNAEALPDLTSRDDKKTYLELKARDWIQTGLNRMDWKNYETNSPVFIDSNLQVKFDGIVQFFEGFSATGVIFPNENVVVTINCVNFDTTSIPSGSGWKLIVQENGIEIFNQTTSTVTYGVEITTSFVAGSQNVYSVLCCTYQIGDNSQTVPAFVEYPIFNGYLLADSSKIQFSTGLKFLYLSFVDGLGMLKSIPYLTNYTNTIDINTNETLLQICLNCLNKLDLPNGFYLNIACNIYAGGMAEADSSFVQIYYAIRNWMNSDYTWQNCLAILETICRSFGAQIFQAKNEFWIANVAERASPTLRYFKYDQTGLGAGFGAFSTNVLVEPYTEAVAHYFVNGDQSKIIRKGYLEIDLKCAATYPPQAIINGNFRDSIVGSVPNHWTFEPGLAGGTCETYHYPDGRARVTMTYGGVGGRTKFYPNSLPDVLINDIIDISFVSGGTGLPILMEILIIDGADEWSFGIDKKWMLNYGGFNPYTVQIGSGMPTISVTTDPCPASGSFIFKFDLYDGVTPFTWDIFSANLTFTTPYQYRLTSNAATATQYKKSVDIILGGASEYVDNKQIASLLDVHGICLNGWYRHGISEFYFGLQRLLIQQYINVQSITQINLEGTIMNVFYGSVYIGTINTLTFTDTTGLYPVNGTYYIFGNSRINYTLDEISGTYLQIGANELSETITDIVTLKI
jgi:hypothetical protein